MHRRVFLPYGRIPYELDLGGRDARVLRATDLPEPAPVRELLDRALDIPLPRLAPGSRITLVVSDATRSEPRAELIEAVRARYAGMQWTLAIATGTHGPCESASQYPNDFKIINHDGHDSRDLVELGVTARGTPVRVHRCVLEADLVVATGCIRPHYFAGFGAGAKAIFPGLGEATAIRINHRLKTHPDARAGSVDANPCRLDLEEAASLVPTPKLLLNGVCGPDDRIHAAVAGDLLVAFREGVALARSWFSVRAPRSRLVIASDHLPVTASLYQAAKIAAAAAPLVAPGGTLAVVAECPDGIGPLETVNEAIFRIGVLPRLPPGARLVLLSGLPRAEVDRTLLDHIDSLSPLLESCPDEPLILPTASHLICEPE